MNKEQTWVYREAAKKGKIIFSALILITTLSNIFSSYLIILLNFN